MTTETTEHYTRLEAGSMSHTHPDCGCWLARDENTGSVSLYHCPTHAAARETADEYDRAVEAVYAEYMALRPEPGPGMAYVMELVARKRDLLRRIKGE